MRFAWTNSVGNPDTNWFLVYPVGDVAHADGSFITKGPAVRLTPNASGLVTNTFELGTYVASNRFLGRGIAFRVPNDHGPTVYCATCGTNNTPAGTGLAVSGFNYYITLVYGTNPPPTYDEITNSLGFLPVHLGQVLTNKLYDISGNVVVDGLYSFLIDPSTSWTNLDWSSQLLLTANTNVLDWFNQWLIGTWTANGLLFTNIPQSGVTGLEDALTYLTNNVGSSGAATNVIDVAAGINVTIVTNGLLRTIAATAAEMPNALTNNDTRAVLFKGPNGVTYSMTNRGTASFENGMILSNRSAPFEIRTADGVVQFRQQYNETGVRVTTISGDGSGLTNINAAAGSGSFTGTFSGTVVVTNFVLPLAPQVLLNPPHIGPSSTVGDFNDTGFNTASVMLPGCGILREIWVQPNIGYAGGLNSNMTNLRLEIFVDGGNTTNLAFRAVNVSLGDLFSNRYRFVTNGDWAIYRDSFGLVTQDVSTNQLAGGYIKSFQLRLPVYYTNYCLLRITNSATGSLWNSGYLNAAPENADNLDALGEYKTWRLRTATAGGYWSAASSNYLFSATGPGICVGWLESLLGTNVSERLFLDSVGPTFLTSPATTWKASGGDDFSLTTYAMFGGQTIGYNGGVLNRWAGPNQNDHQFAIEFYRWFSSDAIHWTNGVTVYIPDIAQPIAQMHSTMFYYSPP